MSEPAALESLRHFAQVRAVTERSLGHGQQEREWLDALALLDQASRQHGLLVEASKADAWDEGHRFTGYEPEPGENPYREGGSK